MKNYLLLKRLKPVPEHSVRNNIWTYNNGKGFATKIKKYT